MDVARLVSLQQEDGRWEGEMVWNTMLLSQYLLTHHVLGAELPATDIRRALLHYRVTRLPNGAWPAHPDGPGSVYVTTLAYVTLRVLGLPPGDPLVAPARTWLDGRALTVPAWGRLWLALLGLYDYEGINPVPPELVLAPRWFPLHPDRLYCHTRYVYLGLSCLYGRRTRFRLGDALTTALRRELFGVADPGFRRVRSATGPDVVAPPHPVLRLVHRVLSAYERRPIRRLRARSVRRCAHRLRQELTESRGHGLSPVNGLLAALVLGDPGVLRGLRAWRWEDEREGLRVAGARSSSWDTAFALRALLSAPHSPAVTTAIRRGYRWLCEAQRTADRDGGWCFSDGVHRWAVSDCTAEALSAILLAHDRPGFEKLSDERVLAAVEFILSRQNDDGGFGTYERRSAPEWVVRLNPAEMYLDCMTDRSHVECSASCVSALARFAARHPGHQPERIERAIGRGVAFLRRRQRPDGAYPAAWGIHFTYSSFFVVEALVTAGVDVRDDAVAGVVRWLVAHQKDDGGWGEHFTSCLTGDYVEHPRSQATMTAWAVLALSRAGGPADAIRRGVAFLRTGPRPDEAACGVFFGSAVLDYRLYRDIFPAWALSTAMTMPCLARNENVGHSSTR